MEVVIRLDIDFKIFFYLLKWRIIEEWKGQSGCKNLVRAVILEQARDIGGVDLVCSNGNRET